MFAEDDLTIQHLEIPKLWKWKNGLVRLCFVFPTKGRGTYIDRQTTRRFSAGDILVLNTRLKGSIHAQGRLTLAFFYARVEDLLTVFPLNEFSRIENSATALTSPWFYRADSNLALKCHPLLQAAPGDLGAEHRCHVLRIVASVLIQESKLDQFRSKENGEALNHGGQLLRSLSMETIQTSSVEQLARQYGCSRRHLNRLFHERFATSISAFKMEMRLLKAIALLRDPGARIGRVARECGFNHPSLFSARFKKRFDASPSEWHSQVLKSESNSSVNAPGDLCLLRATGLCPMPAQPAVANLPARQPVSSDHRRAPEGGPTL